MNPDIEEMATRNSQVHSYATIANAAIISKANKIVDCTCCLVCGLEKLVDWHLQIVNEIEQPSRRDISAIIGKSIHHPLQIPERY